MLYVLVAIFVAVVAHDALRRSTLRRLALRNIARRPAEALVIVAGSLLGTALITAALIVDDTIDHSIRDLGRTRLGPADELVLQIGGSDFDDVIAILSATPIPDTDGVLPATSASAAAASTGTARRFEPDAGLLEVDFDAARRFGGDPKATGLVDAGPTPKPGEAIINRRLARSLRVEAGDRIEVFAFGASLPLSVRQVVPEIGLAGFNLNPVLVAPGTLDQLSTAPGANVEAAPPRNWMMVSNTGGVFGGAKQSDQVVAELKSRLAGRAGVEVMAAKKDLLKTADDTGRSVGQLYTGVAGFSVIAGILLLVNLFVMLAEERRVEIGMLRAVGFKRNFVLRAFALEGTIYAIVAAAIGTVLGIGVGRVITAIASRIIKQTDPDLGFILSVQLRTLITAFAVGLLISLATVWLTSWRIARGNVIAAIRDIREPERPGRHLIIAILSAVGVLVGGLMLISGLSGEVAIAMMASVPIVILSLAALIRRFIPSRWVNVGAALAALVWTIGVFSFFPDATDESGIEVFLVMGVVLVASSITIVTSFPDLWTAVISRVARGNGGLAARLGLAYPLDRRFRTSMLLGMYSLVIFTMTFMSVFSAVLSNNNDRYADLERAGNDVIIDSIASNPVTVESLLATGQVASAAAIARTFPLAKFSIPSRPEPTDFFLSAFDESLLAHGAPALAVRDPRFATDADAFRAVLADRSLIIVADIFLQAEGGPPETKFKPGDPVEIYDPETGRPTTLSIAGVLSSDSSFNGAFVGKPFHRDFLAGRSVDNRHYVKVRPNVDAKRFAETTESALFANGADVATFQQSVDKALTQFRSFIALMRGYLALGLVIGIAGLGVVMVRAVRERRREIGMLRAMGVASLVVRRAFLLEAAFIALQGILIGVILGLVTSWSVLANSDVFSGGVELRFAVPWFAVGVIISLPLLASLVAAVVPARRAAQIKPAAALRIAG